MSVIILAGGRSTRLGQDKTSLVFGGRNLLQRTVDLLSQLNQEIILVLAPGQTTPVVTSSREIRVARDQFKGKGPLIGLYAGLRASSDDQCLAVACDMPLLNLDLLRYMLDLTLGFDIVIPRLGHFIEPLHAVYSKSCQGEIHRLIGKGDRQIRPLLDLMKVRYVQEGEIDRFDPEHLSFFNINRPEDLKKAEEIIARQGVPK